MGGLAPHELLLRHLTEHNTEVHLFRDGMPSIGNSDQGQEGKEYADQDAPEYRRIFRLRGLLANLADHPSDQSGDRGD